MSEQILTAGDDALCSPSGEIILSVVIPHYNHGDLLPRAVASVLPSSVKAIEIIIVDDGSVMPHREVVLALEQTCPPVRAICCATNRGAPSALNIGLQAARGRYVHFLGADDLVLPAFYSVMIKALQRYPVAPLACGEIAIVDESGAIRGIRPFAAPAFRRRYLCQRAVSRKILRHDNWICSTATLYRTDVVRAAGGFDENLGSLCDGMLNRLLALSHGFVFVPGIYGIWQVAAHTASATSFLDWREGARVVALAQERLATSRANSLVPAYPDLFARRSRFSAARMQFTWNTDPDPVRVAEVLGNDIRDQRVLTGIRRYFGFGAFGRTLALGWLFARLQPLAPGMFLVNLIRNQLALILNRSRIGRELHLFDHLLPRNQPSTGGSRQ